jgi:hypothetical protein
MSVISSGSTSDFNVTVEANPRATHAQGYQSASQSEDDFEDFMAATLDLAEPDAGTWEEIKTKFGL